MSHHNDRDEDDQHYPIGSRAEWVKGGCMTVAEARRAEEREAPDAR